MKAHIGIPNPAFVNHPRIASQRRIRVEGFADSDCHYTVAVMQFTDGRIGLAIDGIEASFENLVRVHQLLTEITAEVDRRLSLYAQTIPGEP